MEKIWINVKAFTQLPIFNDTTRVMHKLLLLAVKEDEEFKVFLNTNIREQILEDCRVPKSSYCRAIGELEECGFLTRDRDILTLNLPKGFELPVIYKRK